MFPYPKFCSIKCNYAIRLALYSSIDFLRSCIIISKWLVLYILQTYIFLTSWLSDSFVFRYMKYPFGPKSVFCIYENHTETVSISRECSLLRSISITNLALSTTKSTCSVIVRVSMPPFSKESSFASPPVVHLSRFFLLCKISSAVQKSLRVLRNQPALSLLW